MAPKYLLQEQWKREGDRVRIGEDEGGQKVLEGVLVGERPGNC